MNMNKLSQRLANKLIDSGANASMHEVYAYGIECILSTAIILVLLIVGGAILGKLPLMLLYILFWLPLRMMVGGFHASTHLWCTVCSVVLGAGAVYTSDYITAIPLIFVIITLAIAYAVILSIAPVIHENHPVSDGHRKKMRGFALIFGAIELGVILALFFAEKEAFAVAFLGYLVTVILAVVGKLSKTAI